MSDVTPSHEECEVDPDLTRRVAWGMIAGKSKAEIAAAEDITPEECEIVCTAPGMFSIMNVWVNFLERRKEGGRKYTRKLTGWCVDHVFQHAPERLNRNEIWRLDRLSSVMLDYGFAIVFGWMLGFLDGVMGIPGSRRKALDDFRQNLVDLLCWAVEVTFREKMLEQYSVELLIAKDGAFQAAIAGREYIELGIGGGLGSTEVAADRAVAASSSVDAPQAGPGPTVSERRPRTSGASASRRFAPTRQRAWPLRVGSDPVRATSRALATRSRYDRSSPLLPASSSGERRWRADCHGPIPLGRSPPSGCAVPDG